MAVCTACAARWTSCERPLGRRFRLRSPWALRDVDPAGRVGLASRSHGTSQLFDLRALRWVESPSLPKPLPIGPRPVAPVLTRRSLVCEVYDSAIDPSVPGVRLVFLPLAGGPARAVATSHGCRWLRACRSGDHVWTVHGDERLHVVAEPGGEQAGFHPLPGQVLQAAFVDVETRKVAVATWRHVALFAMASADQLETLAQFKLGEDMGDVRWVGFGGSRLAAVAESAGGGFLARARRGVLHVWDVGGSNGGRASRLALRLPLAEAGPAAMSADGRFVAMARDRAVLLHDLDRVTTVALEDHDQPLCTVRFVAGDKLLVTADVDGGVALRPREPDGFAGRVVEATIPAETIDAAASLAEPRRAG